MQLFSLSPVCIIPETLRLHSVIYPVIIHFTRGFVLLYVVSTG